MMDRLKGWLSSESEEPAVSDGRVKMRLVPYEAFQYARIEMRKARTELSSSEEENRRLRDAVSYWQRKAESFESKLQHERQLNDARAEQVVDKRIHEVMTEAGRVTKRNSELREELEAMKAEVKKYKKKYAMSEKALFRAKLASGYVVND